jgi:uncharacterized protein YjlB
MMNTQPAVEAFHLHDDGLIPNNRMPLLLYCGAVVSDASAIEVLFESNQWTGLWRNGIYPFHHYHSVTHEVLGCYLGEALVCFGGEKGIRVTFSAGDVVVIPAGVAHRNLESSDDFGVVGAYPSGSQYDICYGQRDERPVADERIAAVPMPATDPIFGYEGPLFEHWKL